MFGDNMKRNRERLQMTQRELGERLNLSQPTIAQLERGSKQPSVTTLNEMSEIFSCTVDSLTKGATTT